MNVHLALGMRVSTQRRCVRGGADEIRVTSLAEARALLIRPELRLPARDALPETCPSNPGEALIARGRLLRALWMWGPDTARHGAIRKVASATMSPAAIVWLVEAVASHARALLGADRGRPGFDFITEFSEPVAQDAFFTLFGIPQARRPMLLAHFNAMRPFVSTPGTLLPGTAHYFALGAVGAMIEDAWRNPPPDAIASRALLHAIDAGLLRRDEAIAQAIVLLFGNQTTVVTLSALMARLSERPDIWAKLRAGTLSVECVVEEGLRLGPPVHMTLIRIADSDVALASGTIPAGGTIRFQLGALNRDPEAFGDPCAFDPARGGPKHLAFGAGSHMCIGVHVARAILCTAIAALVEALEVWPRVDIAYGPSRLNETGVAHMVLAPEAS